jgi:pimeloyl-ACP methyl ester carboxylesterase
MSRTEDRTGGDLREGYAEVGDVRLHYVETGDGPLIVLLHGFPEFWYGWRQQIKPLAAAVTALPVFLRAGCANGLLVQRQTNGASFGWRRW